MQPPFEQGYAAFLNGAGRDGNPYDKKEKPYYHKQWDKGWIKARVDKGGSW